MGFKQVLEKKQFIFGFLLPILIGGLIYVFFRSNTLIMFSWFNDLRISPIILDIRQYTMPFKNYFPDWFLYSLPDGLWIFSYTSLILLLSNNIIKFKNIFWILIIFIYVISIEFLQLFGLYNGTFDIFDILFYISGVSMPFIFYANQK